MVTTAVNILHIFPDDKFFDGVSAFFDSLDGVTNHYYLYTTEPDYKFSYIQHTEKVTIISDFAEYCRILRAPGIDIIYLHSMCDWKLFRYFGRDKKIIWWSWGYDIYNSPDPLCPALIPIELYRPATAALMQASVQPEADTITRRFFLLLKEYYHIFRRNKILSRVDYFTPVLPVEYELMKRNRSFRAKPFCVEFGPGFDKFPQLRQYPEPGNILIGNSFSPTNNHLDIFNIVKHINLNPRKYVIPINYGDGYKISARELEHISGMPEDSTLWLHEFMPPEQYAWLNQSTTHAIFGHIRQQAVGNHRICILNGVKMYFYRNSINYKYYNEKGFHVYTIEDDLNAQSLSENLSPEKAAHNYNLLCEVSRDNRLKYQSALHNIVSE